MSNTDLEQFKDCAGRPEKEGFLVSKDKASAFYTSQILLTDS